MKSYNVKSNATRAARRLCELVPGITPFGACYTGTITGGKIDYWPCVRVVGEVPSDRIPFVVERAKVLFGSANTSAPVETVEAFARAINPKAYAALDEHTARFTFPPVDGAEDYHVFWRADEGSIVPVERYVRRWPWWKRLHRALNAWLERAVV